MSAHLDLDDAACGHPLAVNELCELRADVQRLKAICVAAHDRLLRGDDDRELLALLETAWKPAP